MGASVALAAVAMVVRLRRSHGFERQQLKWIAFAAAFTGVAVVADVASFFVALEGVDQLRIVLLGLGFSASPRSPRARRSCATASTTSTS